MKRLDKRSLFVLIVTIAFLVAMVIYGAYAVINVSPQVNTNNLNIHSNISGPLNFTVEGGNVINLEVSKMNMGQSFSGNYVASANDNLTVRLQTDGKQDICCTYKIAWEWIEDSNTDNQYTKSTGAQLEYTLAGSTNSTNGVYGFESQLADYDAINRTAVVYKNVQICNRNNGVLSSNVTQDWTFTNKLYNLNVNQDALKAGNFKGKTKIIDVNCDVDSSINSQILEKSNQTSSQDSSSWAIVNEAGGLRYEGKDPDNYVCFKESCTDDELYRIIGKFTEMVDTNNDGTADTSKSVIKIIKNTSIGTQNWDYNGDSDWSTASLYTYLNNTWDKPTSDMLTTRWHLGGSDSADYTASQFLDKERGNVVYGTNSTYVDAKVGLMYPSDYGFAVQESECSRSKTLSNYYLIKSLVDGSSLCYDYDWLSYEDDEWTITHYTSKFNRAFYIDYSSGAAGSSFKGNKLDYSLASNLESIYEYAFRPTFYISTSTKIVSGTGSKSSPYKIASESYTIADYLEEYQPAGYRGSTHTNATTQNMHRYVGGYQSTDAGYAGNIDNYICLGSSATTCPVENMYRIIGVVASDDATTGLEAGMVKVIKNISIGNYKWDGGTGASDTNGSVNSSNYETWRNGATATNADPTSGIFPTWSQSYLNTGILNTTYLNGLSFSDKIASVKWHCYVGSTTPTSASEYSASLCSNTSSKIGIIYAGDYLNAYNNGTNNSGASRIPWLQINNDCLDSGSGADHIYECGSWTMANYGFYYSSDTNYSWRDWIVGCEGNFSYNDYFFYWNSSSISNSHLVRPVFYINNDIELSRGTGTYSDPFRINEN